MKQIFQVGSKPRSQHGVRSAFRINQKLEGAYHMSWLSHGERAAQRLQSGAQVSAHSRLTEEVDLEWYYWCDERWGIAGR